MKSRIKPFEFVRYLGEPEGDFSHVPFKSRDRFIFLGETKQMQDHGTFVRTDGRVFVNYHIYAFERVPNDEA